jgi:hypothetical protein
MSALYLEETSLAKYIQMKLLCYVLIRDPRETIESGPLCITDLFHKKSEAYF